MSDVKVIGAAKTEQETFTGIVAQRGLPFKALLTNFSCIFGLQSGVAAINPRTSIRGVVQKKLPLSLNWDRLPSEVKEYFDGKKASFVEWVETQIGEIAMSGKVFKYGEDILTLEVKTSKGVFRRGLVRNNKMNQPLKPTGVTGLKYKKDDEEKREEDLSMDIIKMSIVCDLDITSQWWKLRGDGVKATTCPLDLKFFLEWNDQTDIPIEWDVMFGIETLKGGLAFLEAYVEANGGGTIYMDKGILEMTNGLTIDLLKGGGVVDEWLKKNTHTLWVEFPMCNAEVRSLLLKRGKTIALPGESPGTGQDVVIMKALEDHCILRERIEVLAQEL